MTDSSPATAATVELVRDEGEPHGTFGEWLRMRVAYAVSAPLWWLWQFADRRVMPIHDRIIHWGERA